MTAAAPAQVFVVGEKTAEADVVTDFHPTHVQLPTEPLSQAGYLDLVRNLEAEQGFAHRELPLGAGLTLIANGNLTPRGDEYRQMLYKKGESAAPGDRVAITALKVERDRIIIDVNGGPYAKHRFLSHVSINDMALAQQGPLATGARITLVFEGGVPEITAAEVKALLDPIIDFKARSASEAYANTLSPVAREAIESHRILVGMDRRMVLASLGEPKEKQREHTDSADPNSPVSEEWIYGEPPTPIQFVRFRNGRVVRLEVAVIGKPVEIHEKNEMGPDFTQPVLQARTIVNGDDPRAPGGELGSRRPPTLAKPGETLDTHATTMGKVIVPDDPAAKKKDCPGPATSANPNAPASTTGTSSRAGGNQAAPPPCATPAPEAASTASATFPARTGSPQPSLSPGLGSIGSADAGLPGDTDPSGMGGGAPSSRQGTGYPGGQAPGGSSYPPGMAPTLPGSNIPVGPQHMDLASAR